MERLAALDAAEKIAMTLEKLRYVLKQVSHFQRQDLQLCSYLKSGRPPPARPYGRVDAEARVAAATAGRFRSYLSPS